MLMERAFLLAEVGQEILLHLGWHAECIFLPYTLTVQHPYWPTLELVIMQYLKTHKKKKLGHLEN